MDKSSRLIEFIKIECKQCTAQGGQTQFRLIFDNEQPTLELCNASLLHLEGHGILYSNMDYGLYFKITEKN